MKFLPLLVLISIFISVELKKAKTSTGAKIIGVAAQSTFDKANSMKSKSSFAEISQINYKEVCKKNENCEACALEWDCSYGVTNQENQEKEMECYKYCLGLTDDKDLHEKVMQTEGTKRQK